MVKCSIKVTVQASSINSKTANQSVRRAAIAAAYLIVISKTNQPQYCTMKNYPKHRTTQ